MRKFSVSLPILVTSFAFVWVTLAPAAAADMSGNEIRKAVAGQTVYVTSSDGSIPIRYSSNGTMRAKTAGIVGLTGIANDSGRWWISGKRLCQKWKRWLNGKTHCITLRRKGAKYYWTATSGKSGTARVSSR